MDAPRGGGAGDAGELLAGAARELAQAIAPGLQRFLVDATREVEAVARSVDQGSSALASESLLARVDELETESHGHGWVLGVIAAASGVDLLRERRDRDGLRRVVARVVEVALPGGIEPDPATLPRVGSTHGAGWELPFLAGFLFLRAARAAPARTLSWSTEARADGTALLVDAPGSDPRLDAVIQASGCARPLRVGGRAGLIAPPGWLEPR
jgi:hypothetical protein